ncbi:hypothetical protein BHE74_00016643, partial [Ensete ventricosum]
LSPSTVVDRPLRLPAIAFLFASLRSSSRKKHHRRAREKAVAVLSLSLCVTALITIFSIMNK